MKLEMTAKDKQLLVMLSIFVIVVCIGYWGVYPMIKGIKDYSAKIEMEEEQKSINDMKILQLPMVIAENGSMEEDIVVAKKDFYPIMKSDEIDKMLTGMAVLDSLHAYDMVITMPKTLAELAPYRYSAKALEMEETLPNEENYLTGIYAAKISMRLGGEEDNLNKFLEELMASKKKLRLVSYEWMENRRVVENADGGYDLIEGRELLVNLEIYMCEE